MKVLLSMPDTGLELGWKLYRYQGILRAMAPDYDKVVVFSNTMGIYEDFAEDAMTAFIGEKSMWKVMNNQITRIEPCREICCNPKLPQVFHRYAKHVPIKKRITIHARNRVVGKERNWSVGKWNELVNFLHKKGYVVTSIGTEAHNIDVDLDARGVPFKALCKIIASSAFVIGPSSGIPHLASIIGTPHIVWSHTGKQNLGGVAGTNRERYKRYWNPFGTKCSVIDQFGWQPEPKVVLDEIERFWEAH